MINVEAYLYPRKYSPLNLRDVFLVQSNIYDEGFMEKKAVNFILKKLHHRVMIGF